jgi:hypothetical protein
VQEFPLLVADHNVVLASQRIPLEE